MTIKHSDSDSHTRHLLFFWSWDQVTTGQDRTGQDRTVQLGGKGGVSSWCALWHRGQARSTSHTVYEHKLIAV